MEKTRPRVRAVARAGMAALRQAGGGVEKAHDRHHSMACSVGRNWLGWVVDCWKAGLISPANSHQPNRLYVVRVGQLELGFVGLPCTSIGLVG